MNIFVLKSPGVEIGLTFIRRMWLGVRASKSSLSSETLVIRLLHRTASTSHFATTHHQGTVDRGQNWRPPLLSVSGTPIRRCDRTSLEYYSSMYSILCEGSLQLVVVEGSRHLPLFFVGSNKTYATVRPYRFPSAEEPSSLHRNLCQELLLLSDLLVKQVKIPPYLLRMPLSLLMLMRPTH